MLVFTVANLPSRLSETLINSNIKNSCFETNLCLSTTNVLSVSAEGSDEVGGGQKSILVSVHDAKGLLELLDGRVGEGVEDVGFLRHDGVGGGAGGS